MCWFEFFFFEKKKHLIRILFQSSSSIFEKDISSYFSTQKLKILYFDIKESGCSSDRSQFSPKAWLLTQLWSIL